MPARYCPCGGKTEYTAKVPTFCSSCGQPFGATFAKAAPIVVPIPSLSVTSKPAVIRALRRPPVNPDDVPDQYDEREMIDRAQEIAASFSASDFFSATQEDNRGHRLTDVLDPTKQINVGMRGGVINDPSQLPALPE